MKLELVVAAGERSRGHVLAGGSRGVQQTTSGSPGPHRRVRTSVSPVLSPCLPLFPSPFPCSLSDWPSHLSCLSLSCLSPLPVSGPVTMASAWMRSLLRGGKSFWTDRRGNDANTQQQGHTSYLSGQFQPSSSYCYLLRFFASHQHRVLLMGLTSLLPPAG